MDLIYRLLRSIILRILLCIDSYFFYYYYYYQRTVRLPNCSYACPPFPRRSIHRGFIIPSLTCNCFLHHPEGGWRRRNFIWENAQEGGGGGKGRGRSSTGTCKTWPKLLLGVSDIFHVGMFLCQCVLWNARRDFLDAIILHPRINSSADNPDFSILHSCKISFVHYFCLFRARRNGFKS